MPLPAPLRTGRPKDPAKHAAILAAATHLFTTMPYDLVKMEDVASLAGVAKMTVYNHFDDKEGLFESIVSSVSDGMIAALASPDPGHGSLEERLVAVGLVFLRLMLGPPIAALCHSLPGALRANRDLGPRFYNAGPGRSQAALAAIIRDELAIAEADQAACDLVALWEGGIPAQVAFGVLPNVTDEDIERRARHGTKLFLRAYGKDKTESSSFL